MPSPLELSEPRRLLDQRAPLRGLGRKDLLDAALPDDGMHLPAEADVREQLDDVGAANVCAVDEVLALAAAVEAPRDRELGELERPVTVLVVEEKLHLAEGGGVTPTPTPEEDVVRLLCPELARAQASGSPDDRVRDVRLARAVRPDDDGHARLEAHLDRVRERLEAAQLDRSQVQRPQSDEAGG